MLFFIGLGIGGQESISEKTRKVISESDMVFF